MPCTYCSSNRHTRGKCDKIEKDFKTYEKVSILAREKYINTLLEKGIRPGAVVRTYNRGKNFMNKFSETKVVNLGKLDILSHYKKIGRSITGIYIESQNLIELADDNEDRVSVKHCYEIVEPSSEEWDTTGNWAQTQLLGFDEFKATTKGKKRHPAFTGEIYTCIVKKLTIKEETLEEIVARVNVEAEKKEAGEETPVTIIDTITDEEIFARLKKLDTTNTGEKMSVTIIDTINNLDVTDDTIVTLRYEDSHEGWHSTGELEDDAVTETNTANAIAELITDKNLLVRTVFGDEVALDSMRDADLLEEYERGSFEFETFIADVIKQNACECDDLIDFETIQYDHKRGRCEVSSELTTTVGNMKKAAEAGDGDIYSLAGWTASFEHSGGTFSTDM